MLHPHESYGSFWRTIHLPRSFRPQQDQLGKKTWSEDIRRGKRKKKWQRNVDEFNMRWRKKDFCQITWQWGTVSPCWGHSWKQTGEPCDSSASLFSFSHRDTNGWKCRLWHAHSYMRDGKNPPLPRHTAHIPPHALPRYKEVLQGFTFNSLLLSWRWAFWKYHPS